MALPADFSKIFGSTATGGLTPISDVNYAKGWEFVGATPPTKNDFSYLQNLSDLKSQWLYSNKLQRANPFGDIKSDGASAIATALANLGLGEAAKRNVGTGENQIPDMVAFASGSGWFRLPSGYIVQFGTFAGNAARIISGYFPIPFPNQPLVSVGFMSDSAQSVPSNPTPLVLSVNFEHVSNSAWRAGISDASQQYRFAYISIGR